MNNQVVTINLIPDYSVPAIVRLSQYDVERPIVFRVLDGNVPATFPSGATATCVGTKPSGLGFQVLGTIGLGGTVTFSTFLGMTQESGMIPAEIRFTTNEYAGHPATDIGTANFILAIEPSPHAEGTTDGTQETMQNLETRLQAEIDGLDDRIEALENAEESGLTAQEKSLILTLFSKAAYAEDDAKSTYDTLEGLWRVVYRTITYNLTNCISTSSVTSVESNKPYSTNLATQTGYTITSLTVTMGEQDVTAGVVSGGSIQIPQVTGDVVITAVATKELSSITATYTQSGTVYNTDTLDSLKSDLVVTANYSDGTSETVTDYTLSGTLAEGTSTVTVAYGGKTATFNVTVTSSSAWHFNSQTITSADGDFFQGSIGMDYGSGSTHYYSAANNRCSYNGLNVDLSSNYTYEINISTTLSKTVQVAVRELKASGYTKVQEHSKLVSGTDIADSGWQSSGYQFTASDGSYLWFALHTTDNAVITPSDFEVTITRTAVS